MMKIEIFYQLNNSGYPHSEIIEECLYIEDAFILCQDRVTERLGINEDKIFFCGFRITED